MSTVSTESEILSTLHTLTLSLKALFGAHFFLSLFQRKQTYFFNHFFPLNTRHINTKIKEDIIIFVIEWRRKNENDYGRFLFIQTLSSLQFFTSLLNYVRFSFLSYVSYLFFFFFSSAFKLFSFFFTFFSFQVSSYQCSWVHWMTHLLNLFIKEKLDYWWFMICFLNLECEFGCLFLFYYEEWMFLFLFLLKMLFSAKQSFIFV